LPSPYIFVYFSFVRGRNNEKFAVQILISKFALNMRNKPVIRKLLNFICYVWRHNRYLKFKVGKRQDPSCCNLTLVRSFGVPIEPVSETSFKDVPPDAWFAAEVEAAYKGGIAIGFEDGTFRPYAQVNREQIAVFIVRAMNWTVEDEEADALLSKFTDQAKISSWAKEAVAVAVQKGIVLGRPDGNFDPQANATRAEAVSCLTCASSSWRHTTKSLKCKLYI